VFNEFPSIYLGIFRLKSLTDAKRGNPLAHEGVVIGPDEAILLRHGIGTDFETELAGDLSQGVAQRAMFLANYILEGIKDAGAVHVNVGNQVALLHGRKAREVIGAQQALLLSRRSKK